MFKRSLKTLKNSNVPGTYWPWIFVIIFISYAFDEMTYFIKDRVIYRVFKGKTTVVIIFKYLNSLIQTINLGTSLGTYNI